MDTAQWPQEFGVVLEPMEELARSNNTSSTSDITRTLRPPQQQQQQQGPLLQCPRCNSSNTKFCYYNNYSLTQPRYFCKACRRYWTEGGSLRNVPVGGGSRKNKGRSASTSSSTSATSTQNPKFHEGGQELNLCTSTSTTAMELLRSPFVPQMQSMPPMMLECPSGFSSTQPGYRPNYTLTSPSDGGYANRMQGVQESSSTGGGRLMFPFENSRDQFTDRSDDDEQNRRRQEEGEAHGFWNGMI